MFLIAQRSASVPSLPVRVLLLASAQSRATHFAAEGNGKWRPTCAGYLSAAGCEEPSPTFFPGMFW